MTMADELNKLSLKVTYNEDRRDATDEIKNEIKAGNLDNLPEDFRDKYNEALARNDVDAQEQILLMAAIKRDVDMHLDKAEPGKPLIKKDSEGKDVVGLSYKVPVNEGTYGNINVVLLGNGSVVFDDGFKNLFDDYDKASTPEEKKEAEKVIKAKLAAAANVLTEAGVESSSLRNIDGLSDDKKQILTDGLEKVVDNGRQNHMDGIPYAGDSENDEESKKLAEELQSQAAYIASLEQDVKAGKASINELEAAKDKFNGCLSGLGVQKGWLGLKKNCKTYDSIWGEKVFRLYPDEKAMAADGKINKDGTVNHTYSVEVKMKRKKGKLYMSYGLPAGKLLDSSVMKAMLDSYKAAGYKVIALPDGRPGKEYGDWWGAMASKQMVPSADKGPFPDPKDIRDMLKTVTEKGIGDGKVIEWLDTMAREADKKAGSNTDMRKVVKELKTKSAHLKKEQKFHFSESLYDKEGNEIGNFKTNMEGILTDIEDAKYNGVYRGKDFDAVDVIATNRAIWQFVDKYYKNGEGGTMADLKGLVPDSLASSNVSLSTVVTDKEKMASIISFMADKLKGEVEKDIVKNIKTGDNDSKNVETVLGKLTGESVRSLNRKLSNISSDEFGVDAKWNQQSNEKGKTDTPAVEKFKKYQGNNHVNPIVSRGRDSR